MKKAIFFLSFVVFVIFLTVFALGADVAVVDEYGQEYMHESYSFYLPSHISPSAVKIKLASYVDMTYADKNGEYREIKASEPIDLRPYKTSSQNGVAYVLPVKYNDIDYYLIFRFASSLPSVNIQTTLAVEKILANGKKDTAVKTTVLDKNGEIVHSDGLYGGELKVRGNATAAYAKKPFQLKLSHKTDLFGMGSDKTWLLLANYDDQSLLRNSIMYTLGKFLGMQTTEFISVDVFINGRYYGVYLLCEKVQIDKGRLEIFDLEEENDLLNGEYRQYATTVTSGALIDSTVLVEYRYIEGVINPSDISGGYLIELDNNYYKDELCYFVTEFGSHYVIKSPEYASREEVEYIAKLFADMEEAIMSENGYNCHGKHYTEYVDIDSLATAYIMQEFGRNYDSGSSSMYFYKDKDENGVQATIYKGPLWDCDNTLGNIHKNGASNPEGYWAKDRSIWKGLTKKAEFNELVSEKFTLAYDFIFDMIDSGGFIDDEIEFIGDSIYMEIHRWGSNNYDTWPLYYDGIHYDRWQSSQVFNFKSVYSSGANADDSTVIGYLLEHMEKRANWLAEKWECDVILRQRVRVEPPKEELPENEAPMTPPCEIPPSGALGGETDSTQASDSSFTELFDLIKAVLVKIVSVIINIIRSLLGKLKI